MKFAITRRVHFQYLREVGIHTDLDGRDMRNLAAGGYGHIVEDDPDYDVASATSETPARVQAAPAVDLPPTQAEDPGELQRATQTPEVTNANPESKGPDDVVNRPSSAGPATCEQCDAVFPGGATALNAHLLKMRKRGDRKHPITLAGL
jgi:hypothetical protein